MRAISRLRLERRDRRRSLKRRQRRAPVFARRLEMSMVACQVDGQIYCDGRVEIRPTGRVTGEINARALIVQEGAYFDGNSKMAIGNNSVPSASANSTGARSTAEAARA